MKNQTFVRPLVLVVLAVGVLIVVFGIFRVLEATNKFNEMDAIPVESLVATAGENSSSATSLALLDKAKKDALIARSQALSVIGFGAVVIGIAGFVFAQFSYPNTSASNPQSSTEVRPNENFQH
jgi:hypothetical protein